MNSQLFRIESDGTRRGTIVTHISTGEDVSRWVRDVEWSHANGLPSAQINFIPGAVRLDVAGPSRTRRFFAEILVFDTSREVAPADAQPGRVNEHLAYFWCGPLGGSVRVPFDRCEGFEADCPWPVKCTGTDDHAISPGRVYVRDDSE